VTDFRELLIFNTQLNFPYTTHFERETSLTLVRSSGRAQLRVKALCRRAPPNKNIGVLPDFEVCPQNLKDFYNLVNVYLDSVLHPALTPWTLKQEGWHYDIEDETKPLTYKGVVFNEMKGVYSSPDAIHGRTCQQALFPDNTYGVDSGGDPAVIPELTWENFEGFHKKVWECVDVGVCQECGCVCVCVCKSLRICMSFCLPASQPVCPIFSLSLFLSLFASTLPSLPPPFSLSLPSCAVLPSFQLANLLLWR